MTRITMTINTKFNLPLETFCGEDLLTIFSNVVPEKKKKKRKKKKFNLIVFLRNEG